MFIFDLPGFFSWVRKLFGLIVVLPILIKSDSKTGYRRVQLDLRRGSEQEEICLTADQQTASDQLLLCADNSNSGSIHQQQCND